MCRAAASKPVVDVLFDVECNDEVVFCDTPLEPFQTRYAFSNEYTFHVTNCCSLSIPMFSTCFLMLYHMVKSDEARHVSFSCEIESWLDSLVKDRRVMPDGR